MSLKSSCCQPPNFRDWDPDSPLSPWLLHHLPTEQPMDHWDLEVAEHAAPGQIWRKIWRNPSAKRPQNFPNCPPEKKKHVFFFGRQKPRTIVDHGETSQSTQAPPVFWPPWRYDLRRSHLLSHPPHPHRHRSHGDPNPCLTMSPNRSHTIWKSSLSPEV